MHKQSLLMAAVLQQSQKVPTVPLGAMLHQSNTEAVCTGHVLIRQSTVQGMQQGMPQGTLQQGMQQQGTQQQGMQQGMQQKGLQQQGTQQQGKLQGRQPSSNSSTPGSHFC